MPTYLHRCTRIFLMYGRVGINSLNCDSVNREKISVSRTSNSTPCEQGRHHHFAGLGGGHHVRGMWCSPHSRHFPHVSAVYIKVDIWDVEFPLSGAGRRLSSRAMYHSFKVHTPAYADAVVQESQKRRTSNFRACEPCRKRKTRCDGCRPCENCRRYGVESSCQYAEGTRRPSYVKR